MQHVPVFLERSIEWLDVSEDGIYVDCTAGGGGHSEAIAQRLTAGRLIALDRDAEAVATVRDRLAKYPQATVLQRNYGELAAALGEHSISSVNGVLLDAGCSSMQLDAAARGFSFQAEGPLDMRMDRDAGPTAAEFLSAIDALELTRILRDYGDVGPAARIAQAIVEQGKQGRLQTTTDLRDAVAHALPFVQGMPEETRTVFQAIRIAVNDELRWLERGLRQAIDVLAPGGRLVVIAFHSGEDRVVKSVFREVAKKHRELAPDGRVVSIRQALVDELTPKPERPTPVEVAANSRAASARLRVVRKKTEV